MNKVSTCRNALYPLFVPALLLTFILGVTPELPSSCIAGDEEATEKIITQPVLDQMRQ